MKIFGISWCLLNSEERLNQLPSSVLRALVRELSILRVVSIAKPSRALNIRSLKSPIMQFLFQQIKNVLLYLISLLESEYAPHINALCKMLSPTLTHLPLIFKSIRS